MCCCTGCMVTYSLPTAAWAAAGSAAAAAVGCWCCCQVGLQNGLQARSQFRTVHNGFKQHAGYVLNLRVTPTPLQQKLVYAAHCYTLNVKHLLTCVLCVPCVRGLPCYWVLNPQPTEPSALTEQTGTRGARTFKPMSIALQALHRVGIQAVWDAHLPGVLWFSCPQDKGRYPPPDSIETMPA